MTMTRLEAVLASINESADAAQEKLAKAGEFASRSEHLQVEGHSEDKLARVMVDGTGQVQSIDLDDDFAEHSAAQVSGAVLAAMRQAQRRLSFRIDQLGEEIYGEESPSATAFTNSYRQRFGYEEVPSDEW